MKAFYFKIRKYPGFFINVILLILAIVFLSACPTPPDSIYTKAIGEPDYKYLNEEFQKLQFPNIDQNKVNIKFKFVRKDTPDEPIGYQIYVGKVNGDYLNKLVDSLKLTKILVNQPISDRIMFRFKLVGSKTFNIYDLRPKIGVKNAIEVNNFQENENVINRTNGYYYFHDFTVYRNPEKTRRKHSEGKLVFLDLTTNLLLFYSDYINYPKK
jgi:hypothetical protein